MLTADTEDQALVREAVAGIAGDFGHGYYSERARAGKRTDELWQAISDAGFVGINLPVEHGGGGMGITELSLVIEELAAAGCPLLMLVVSPAICGSIIARHAEAELRDRWLPGLASGESKMAFAITEPDAGSNSHEVTTSATRDGDRWVLKGTKYYISGIDEADAVLVVARTGVRSDGRNELSLFVVPTDSSGLELTPIEVELVAPERQFTVFFDDVAVPADALVGEPGDGLRQVFTGLNPERITGAAMANGIGRYALDKAARYAREREVWGVPIGSHQGIAHPLAESYIEVELARLATAEAARRFDGDDDAGEASNIAKFAAADAALSALDNAIQAHGGNGLATEYGLADMWFVARLLRTAPISREMILNFVAQHSLALPRSY